MAAPMDPGEFRALATRLREEDRHDELKGVLVRVGRAALQGGLGPDTLAGLAQVLNEHQEFGYARRLMRRAREATQDPERKRALQRREALFTYKDLELPAGPRFDRALEILDEGILLKECEDADWLGLAGAILKRRWQVGGSSDDLDQARWCYLRGWELEDDPERCYPGINAAYVLDLLASIRQERAVVPTPEPDALRAQADAIRAEVARLMQELVKQGKSHWWHAMTLVEAHFGLGQIDQALEALKLEVAEDYRPEWWLESTATQLLSLAQLRGLETAGAPVLRELVPDAAIDPAQLATGKVGLALSGGGFRASLFHVGVLARLAELDLLRRVEVLSCVSGGSIAGAFYYLKLRERLQQTEDDEIGPGDYVALVAELAAELLDAVQGNLRVRLTSRFDANWRMLRSDAYSRTDQIGELLEERIFSRVKKHRDDGTPWLVRELGVRPAGAAGGFSPVWGNWQRRAKVPMLVLNATALNTGHTWQFTATWMGEPPTTADEEIDANYRLRRMYYGDARPPHGDVTLGRAVAASACVPVLFPPVAFDGLYDDLTVKLVDGGVHDNQGVASLLEQDCSTLIVSDASGQMGERDDPGISLGSVARRTNSMLSARVRAAQFGDLSSRVRSCALRALVYVHMRKGLDAEPRNWVDCQDPYEPADDITRTSQEARRAGYGIDEAVQRALSELRTDLDAFADDEALALMAAGYTMARYELETVLPEVAMADPPVTPKEPWVFAPMLATLGRPGRETGLDVALSVGRSLFFKPARWAWARHGIKLEGRPARGRDALRRAGAKAVWPLRAGISAPVAAVGSLLTRGYLSTIDRRFTRRRSR
jgi:predicted acylesterase/phospholipase RssA